MALKAETLQALHMTEDELNNALIKDVQSIFINMVGVEDIMHMPIFIDLETHFSHCLTAMVGMAGTYNGLVSIHVPWPLTLSFTSLMLGMEVTERNEDVTDAMGEIANMVAGSFKQHLSKGGLDVQLSTPSVVDGSEYTVTSGCAVENITFKFSVGDEWFMVSLSIED
jgi:chemotaxis protein CheX